MAKCKHIIGFLFLRDCGNESYVQCSSCNRPVCDEHTKHSGTSVVCPECYLGQSSGNRDDDEFRRRNRHRSHYRKFGYAPYHHYHDNDYNTFDKKSMDQNTANSSDVDDAIEADAFLDS